MLCKHNYIAYLRDTGTGRIEMYHTDFDNAYKVFFHDIQKLRDNGNISEHAYITLINGVYVSMINHRLISCFNSYVGRKFNSNLHNSLYPIGHF